MKNFTNRKFLIVIFSAILAIGITSNSYSQCEISSGAPTIDNTIEAIWSSATVHPITLPLPSTTPPSGFSAQWRCLYTSTNLYFLFEVTKAGSLYNQNGAVDWWKDDAVEVYLDGDNSGGTDYDNTNDFQFGFRYNDGTTVLTGGSNPANSTTGITYNFNVITGGYTVEISIPWTTLNVTPTIGNSFGIEGAVNVSNGPNRVTQMLTYDATGHAYEDPSLFGTVTLEACPIASTLNKTSPGDLTVSPNPFSNQTLISLPSVDSYSLSIINTNGKTVKEYSIANDDKVLITSDGIENGMYYYSAKNSSSNKIYGGKLVINK